jgi:hypothetical protein
MAGPSKVAAGAAASEKGKVRREQAVAGGYDGDEPKHSEAANAAAGRVGGLQHGLVVAAAKAEPSSSTEPVRHYRLQVPKGKHAP